MASRIVINGNEVTNPVTKAAIGTVTVLFTGLTTAAVLFLVLPLVGIVVTLTVGLVAVMVVALIVGIPLVILGGTLLGAILTPFAMLGRRRTLKRPQ